MKRESFLGAIERACSWLVAKLRRKPAKPENVIYRFGVDRLAGSKGVAC